MTDRAARLRKAGYAGSMVMALVVTALLLMPPAEPPVPTTSPIDRLAHAILFFDMVLHVLSVRPRFWPFVVPLAIGYDAALEFVPPQFGRGFEWGDMLANAVGVLGAVPVARWLHLRVLKLDSM